MIAIMTFDKNLDDQLKSKIENSLIVKSGDLLIKNLDNFDVIILKKREDWTTSQFREILTVLRDQEKPVLFITEAVNAEEIQLAIQFDAEIIFEPIVIDEILTKINEINGKTPEDVIFSDDDYDHKFTSEIEPDEVYVDPSINSIDTFYKEVELEDKEKRLEDDKKELEDKEKEIQEREQEILKKEDRKQRKLEKKQLKKEKNKEKESIFRFILNFIYRILALIVNIIVSFFDNLQWLFISILLTIAAYFIIKELGITSYKELIDMLVGTLKTVIKEGI